MISLRSLIYCSHQIWKCFNSQGNKSILFSASRPSMITTKSWKTIIYSKASTIEQTKRNKWTAFPQYSLFSLIFRLTQNWHTAGTPNHWMTCWKLNRYIWIEKTISIKMKQSEFINRHFDYYLFIFLLVDGLDNLCILILIFNEKH